MDKHANFYVSLLKQKIPWGPAYNNDICWGSDTMKLYSGFGEYMTITYFGPLGQSPQGI